MLNKKKLWVSPLWVDIHTVLGGALVLIGQVLQWNQVTILNQLTMDLLSDLIILHIENYSTLDTLLLENSALNY